MKIFLAIAFLIGGAIMGWKLVFPSAFPSATVRYRLTLEAEVDGRPLSGSGVIEVRYAAQPRISPEAGSLTESVRGEAIALDLGERGMLFAILKAGRDPKYGPEALPLYVFGRITLKDAGAFAALRGLRGVADVPLDKLWMLVHFRNIEDPTTVEAVDPTDLAKSFGPGVKLLRAMIEMTDEPVTTGIEKRLPWWNGPFPWLKPLGNGVYLDTRTEALKINKEDFKLGTRP